MEKRVRVLVTFSIAIILIASLYFFTNWFSLITGYFVGESEQQRIANCLAENGAEFYTSIQCADCERQRELFGRAFDRVPQVDCGEDKSLCPNIQSVPAWYLNKKIHYGLRSLDELKALGGCA